MANNRIKVLKGHLCSSKIQDGTTAHHFSNKNFDGEAICKFNVNSYDSLLSEEQRKFYEDNGFIIFHKFFEDDLLDLFSKHFKDICEGQVPKGKAMLVKDLSLMKTDAKGEFLCYKVQNIEDDKIFSKYIFHSKLLDYVENFTGPNIVAMNLMIVNKPPDSGNMTSLHPIHQDLHYFPYRPENKIVAAWTALESTNVDNGCLFVQPGSHKGPLFNHQYPQQKVNKAFYEAVGYDKTKPIVNLILEKGDTVFFHPLLLHGSGINKTKGFRKSMISHFMASDCVFTTPSDFLAKEVLNMYGKKGIHFDNGYEGYFQTFSRLVRGVQM